MCRVGVWLSLFLLTVSALGAQTPGKGPRAKLSPELEAYNKAIGQPDSPDKAAAIETFLLQHPKSQVREDALENLMRTYSHLRNVLQTVATANRLLQLNPNNVRALSTMTYTSRYLAQNGVDPERNNRLAAEYAQRGLRALTVARKPESLSDAEWAKWKSDTARIFKENMPPSHSADPH